MDFEASTPGKAAMMALGEIRDSSSTMTGFEVQEVNCMAGNPIGEVKIIDTEFVEESDKVSDED
jgi:hypothetical protein